jgi:hypothetical protein
MDTSDSDSLEIFAKALGVTLVLEEDEEEPVTEEVVEEEPVTEEVVEEEPMVEEPVVEEPIVEEPVTEEPVTVEPEIPVDTQMQALNLGQTVERSDQSTEIVPSQEELLLGMSQPAEGEEAVAEGEETTGEIAVEGADTSGVADDIPIKSSEGAFVLNAEAVTFAGRMDIRKMIEEAAESLERQGKRVNIGNIKDPSAQTTGTEDVLISNGEVIISKAMAEEIGGDRLTKINERGKAATEQKIQEQQAQEQQGTPQKTIPVRAT